MSAIFEAIRLPQGRTKRIRELTAAPEGGLKTFEESQLRLTFLRQVS